MVLSRPISFAATFIAFVFAAVAHGQITVDGSRDSLYGDPIVTQTTNSHFGNMDVTQIPIIGGSEWNAAYVHQDNDRIYFMLTGNLEQNFNKLEIFFDSVTGGENVLSAVPEYDFAETSRNLGGLTFDTGFEADYHMYVRGGNTGTDIFDVDFVNREGGTSAGVKSNGVSVAYDASQHTANGSFSTGSLTGAAGNAISAPIEFAINNFNTTGVTGEFADPVVEADVLAAVYGFEFSVRLADLGLDTTQANTFKVAVMQNNGDHNYLSNQILGGLPQGTGNLGSDGTGAGTGSLSGVNFNNFTGNQFFSVSVEAATLICDADGDGDCENNDIVAMYGQAGTAGSLDLDGSGTVDGDDVDDWLNAASNTANTAKTSASHVYELGDLNLSGSVNSSDLGLLLNNFGSTSGVGFAGGDIDMNMNVDSADLGQLLNKFGFTSAAAIAVPEPNALPLLLMGCLVWYDRKRKNR